MQAGNLVAVLFVLLMMIMAGVYASRRNNPNARIMSKQLNPSEASDITESEPELAVKDKEKEVDKMDLIPEENDDAQDDDDEKSPNSNNKKTKRKKSNGDSKEDEVESSDSEEYSMQRMVEEYNKSRTLAKKFAEIIEDISDTFKRKSIEIKRKFEPEAPPAVIKPMSFAEQQAKLQQAASSKSKGNTKVKKESKKKKKKKGHGHGHKKGKDEEDKNEQDFEVTFDDEKEKEKEDEDEEEEIVEKEKDEEVDMIDSADEFGDFNEENFEEFEDFDIKREKMEDDNGAIEIVVNNEDTKNMHSKDINMNKQEQDSDDFDGGAAIEIAIEDEKVKENNEQQVMNEENVIEI